MTIFLCYVALFISYCQTLKIINMSKLREKAIEIAKQTSSESAFMCGYDRACQEYEEKLRWIPVENELPKTYSAVLAVIKSPNCTWVEEIGFGEGKFHLPGRGDTDFVTHWMYLPEPPHFL